MVQLHNKTVAITGASGTMGRSLMDVLLREGAQPIALTTSPKAGFAPEIRVQPWQPGHEAQLRELFHTVDILVLNHGVNVHGARDAKAIGTSLQVNALSSWQLMEIFFETVVTAPQPQNKEVWINTSEAEVGPAFSPLYEISKRLMGDLITLRRIDAPCTLRKIVLGPFKSNLNPIGVMSADWVAGAIVFLAKRNVQNIVVTINPLTYVAFPIKELCQGIYFKLLTRSS